MCRWRAHTACYKSRRVKETSLKKCQNQSSCSIPGRIWQVDLFLGKVGIKKKGSMLNGSEVLVFETSYNSKILFVP